MFNQVKSPAYGTGISANLVSDDQRQRYNYGGRVGFYTDYRGGPVFMGQKGDPIREYWDASMGPIIQSGEPGLIWDPEAGETTEDTFSRSSGFQKGEPVGGYTKGEGIYKVKGAEYGDPEKMDYIPTTYEEMKELSEKYQPWKGRLPNIKNIDEDYMKAQAGAERDALERSMGYDIGTPVEGGGTQFRVEPTKADRVFGETRKSIFGPKEEKEKEYISPTMTMKQKEISGEIDSGPGKEFLEQETETIDVDPFAFLDKSIEAKKKLGRGNALMKAAAAAAEWSGAPTAEKRTAAISKGLTSVGDEAMKAATAGMDLKDRAKILSTIEEVKGKQKMDVWDAKLKEYYGPSMDLAKAELKIKQDTLKQLEAGQEPMAIYDEFLNDADKINVPQLKANKLHTLTNRKVEVALNDEEEKVFKMPENDGVVFIDRNNKVVRYVDGKKQSVDEKTDKYFTWNKP